MQLARHGASSDRLSAGWRNAPAGRLGPLVILHAICVTLALFAATIDVLDTPDALFGSAILMLVFGLPHGTLDIGFVKKASRGAAALIALLYLSSALAMYIIWQAQPILALAVFLVLAVVHFAEDWQDRLPKVMSYGVSLAVLTAPAIQHGDDLAIVFGDLIAADARLLVDVLTLIAPSACATALVAITWLWDEGAHDQAVATALSVIGMISLPPIAGFVLYFCLMHSPGQFRAGLHSIGWTAPQQWGTPVAVLTLAALAIAWVIFLAMPATEVSQRAVSAAFMTLSVLTLPHMMAPRFVWAVRRLSNQ